MVYNVTVSVSVIEYFNDLHVDNIHCKSGKYYSTSQDEGTRLIARSILKYFRLLLIDWYSPF